MNFFETELIPFIDSKYRTSKKRFIIGHSHGAVFSLYTFLKNPDLFDGFIATDPSLGGLNQMANDDIKNSYENKKIYLCSSDIGDAVSDAIKENHLNAFNNFKAILETKQILGLDIMIDHINDDHANSYVQGFSKGIRHISKD